MSNNKRHIWDDTGGDGWHMFAVDIDTDRGEVLMQVPDLLYPYSFTKHEVETVRAFGMALVQAALMLEMGTDSYDKLAAAVAELKDGFAKFAMNHILHGDAFGPEEDRDG